MNTQNFEKLIQQITSRDFKIKTQSETLTPETEYFIYRVLPITEYKISFKWVTPKTEEKFLKSFITAFTTKYREPNPKAYDYNYGGKQYFWADKTEEEKEFAYMHHSSNMFYKNELLKQVQDNFSNPSIESILIKYGFYSTEYGTGIFAFWQTQYVTNAIDKMANFLQSKNIPYKNEFSDARWVYRFVMNINKDTHTNLLKEFSI